MNSNGKGNIALGQAIAYFTGTGFTVSLPLNDSQWYDLIIEKDSVFKTVQVKYTGEKSRNGKTYKCTIKSTSGTTRKKIYSVPETLVDFLFCYCENGDKFLIPVKEIHNNNQITMTRERVKSNFDTSRYYIV